MVRRVDSQTTYAANPHTEVSLTDTSSFVQSSMSKWFGAVIREGDFPFVEMAGNGQYDGLEEHLSFRASEAIGTCAAAANCKVEIEIVGGYTGDVDESALRLRCPLLNFLSEAEATEAEARCAAHHDDAAAKFDLFVREGVAKYDVAKEALGVATRNFNDAKELL